MEYQGIHALSPQYLPRYKAGKSQRAGVFRGLRPRFVPAPSSKALSPSNFSAPSETAQQAARRQAPRAELRFADANHLPFHK